MGELLKREQMRRLTWGIAADPARRPAVLLTACDKEGRAGVVASRTFSCDIEEQGAAMRREALLKELRQLAKKAGKRFEVVGDRGKGSHYRVHFGDRFTTIKSGELTPGYVRLVKRQLGVD